MPAQTSKLAKQLKQFLFSDLYVKTLSRATEQYCAAGAILKPLCLPKQLTLCSQQHIDQLFPGHIICQLFANYVFLERTTVFFLQNMCTVIIGFARERVCHLHIYKFPQFLGPSHLLPLCCSRTKHGALSRVTKRLTLKRVMLLVKLTLCLKLYGALHPIPHGSSNLQRRAVQFTYIVFIFLDHTLME